MLATRVVNLAQGLPIFKNEMLAICLKISAIAITVENKCFEPAFVKLLQSRAGELSMCEGEAFMDLGTIEDNFSYITVD